MLDPGLKSEIASFASFACIILSKKEEEKEGGEPGQCVIEKLKSAYIRGENFMVKLPRNFWEEKAVRHSAINYFPFILHVQREEISNE